MYINLNSPYSTAAVILFIIGTTLIVYLFLKAQTTLIRKISGLIVIGIFFYGGAISAFLAQLNINERIQDFMFLSWIIGSIVSMILGSIFLKYLNKKEGVVNRGTESENNIEKSNENPKRISKKQYLIGVVFIFISGISLGVLLDYLFQGNTIFFPMLYVLLGTTYLKYRYKG